MWAIMLNTAPVIMLQLEPLLQKRGESFYWLAKTTGINHAVMSKLRHNGMKALRLDVLDRICTALECEPGDILVRVPDKKASKR